MLGDSSSTVLATTTTALAASGGGGGVGNRESPPLDGSNHEGSNIDVGGEDDKGAIEGHRSFGGNRWPRQETLALLKIRSDMDVTFRDAGVKGPLWEDVSRKLAELGYNRSAKKCKEKFENVFKYHKRTKDGRSGKQEGRNYRFFDQLEAFESHPPSLSSPLPLPLPLPPQPTKAHPPPVTTIAMSVINPSPNVAGTSHSTVPSTAAATLATSTSQAAVTSSINLAAPPFPSANPTICHPSQATNHPQPIIPSSFPNFSSDLISNSPSSSTSSDVELQGRRKRKRKWKDFFERLMTEVIQRQEETQKRFLEAIEKRENERMVREQSWRMQEMARINREHEILAQERSIAATKDAAVMAFLQKLSQQQNPGQVQNNPPPTPLPPTSPPALPPISQQTPTPPHPLPVVQVPLTQPVANLDITKSDNGDQNFMSASPSRWPKVEVEALIGLRTNLDCKYQENGPKGPLWEEISAGMRKLGYNRNAKRCKEKWENINKYFKKAKESNKKRPEDSKTCPYFHQLDALYKEKNKIDGPSNSTTHIKPQNNSVPLMVLPEQQWPPAQQEHGPDSVTEDLESDDHQNQEDEDEKFMDDEDEDEASVYEVVASKQTSMSTAE